MRQLNAKHFALFMDDLARLAKELPDVTALPLDAIEGWRILLTAIRETCDTHGMVATGVSTDKLLTSICAPNFSAAQCRELSAELRGRLLDEMGGRVFLSLTPPQTRWFREGRPFGQDVAAAFPSASYDLEEATKCLALERSTACVFHLARAIEFAIQLVAKELKYAVPANPNWEYVIRPLREELNKPAKDRSLEWKSDPTFFASITERLMAIRDAWRNPAIHIEGKYTEEEASDICNLAAGLMRLLATKLNESPGPGN